MSKLSADKLPRNIPLVTDVVVPGDPALKLKAYENRAARDHAAVNLQRRINEVETAIGQNDEISPSRAHAIRAEESSR